DMVNTNNSGASASGRATSFQLKAHKSDQSETFTHLYEQFKKKLGISWEASMANGNVPKQTEHDPEGKTLADSYKLLLNLVGDLIPIQENLDIDGNPVLAECYNNVANQSNKDFTDLSLSKLFNLLLYLEEDIMAIQEELGIVGYTNQET
ncbi:20211_t:CDS:2, partial [Dentiscutata erythropus]